MSNKIPYFSKGFGKKRFNKLIDYINAGRVLVNRPGMAQTENGVDIGPIIDNQSVSQLFEFKMIISESSETTVDVSIFGGTVSGLGFSEEVPSGLTLDQWTDFNSITKGEQFYLQFDGFTPNTETRTFDDDNTLYAADDGGSFTGVSLQHAATVPDAVLPVVNPNTGAITTGTFYKRIGSVQTGGTIFQVRKNPQQLAFCAPASLLIWSE